jgi:hypothetical protein
MNAPFFTGLAEPIISSPSWSSARFHLFLGMKEKNVGSNVELVCCWRVNTNSAEDLISIPSRLRGIRPRQRVGRDGFEKPGTDATVRKVARKTHKINQSDRGDARLTRIDA